MELFVIRLVGECTRRVEVLRSSFTFCCTLRFFIIVDVLSHLPHLHNVVLRHRTDDPGFIGVPGKVRDLGCVASVDKQKLRWASQPNWRAIETAAVCEEIRTFGSFSEQFGKYPCNILALCLLMSLSDTPGNVWSTSGICGKLLD